MCSLRSWWDGRAFRLWTIDLIRVQLLARHCGLSRASCQLLSCFHLEIPLDNMRSQNIYAWYAWIYRFPLQEIISWLGPFSDVVDTLSLTECGQLTYFIGMSFLGRKMRCRLLELPELVGDRTWCKDRAMWRSGYLEIELVGYWDNDCERAPDQAVWDQWGSNSILLREKGDLSTFSVSRALRRSSPFVFFV